MKTKLLLFVLALLPTLLLAQEKKPLDYSTYDIWKELDASQISNNGEWVSYEVNPREGDGTLVFQHADQSAKQTFPRGKQAEFSPKNSYAAFKIEPYHDTIQEMKREEVPKDKRPKDSLGIYTLNDGDIQKVANLKSFKLPEEDGEWMAYMYDKKEPARDTTETESEAKEEKETEQEKGSKKDKKDDKDLHQLVITNPVEGTVYEFSRVQEYDISRNGDIISFVRVPADSIDKAKVHFFNTANESHDSLPVMEGTIKNLTADSKGESLAYIHSPDTTDKKTFALYYWESGAEEASRIVDTTTTAIPQNWTVSKHGKIHYSRDNSKLYFGTAEKPEPKQEDTLLESEKVNLDVWHYKDKRLQPQQLKERKEDLKKNYLAVYHISDNKIIQLADENLPDVDLKWHGNTEIALGTHREPYMEKMSYEMPRYADIYQVNVNTGERRKVLEETQDMVSMSPGGNYILHYNFSDSCWYTYNTANKKTVNLTGELDVPFYNVEHDYPNEPYPYFFAGWTQDDEYVLIYDEFDIWKIDPEGQETPVNLTKGRERGIEHRYADLNKEQPYINAKEKVLVKTFNQETKASGFSYLKINREKTEPVLMEDVRFYTPKKAKNDDRLIWRKSTVKMFPDLWISDMDFKNPEKLTSLNPQQEDYNWARVEKIDYLTTDGTTEEALVYKPENFNPDKEYPMMVYFYRLHTDNLHRHYTPRASYSIINPLFYASNGYVVLIPNIRYEIGYPGESALNHVVGATLQMAHKPYIDHKNIGVQGQSWGGYEIAYMVTRTDIFKAASPGAPVSNMTSAYGGIRWGSGLVRQFQYEETQSRIGGSLWEKPLQYIENSPVFWADKIQTPLLIRHDDDDGAVPWYQGIELFTALRRFEKPAWLINYNDAPHNLTKKRANRKDWSKRMKQFFDHYLKAKPAPVWLKEGIPATEKGDTYGFELTD